MKLKAEGRGGVLRLSLRGADPMAWRAAACRMTREAHVLLDRGAGRSAAALRPTRGARLPALARAFERAYEQERRRWSDARAGFARQAEALRRALASGAADGPATAPGPALTPEQAREIQGLLAEAESAAKDPLGIAAPWQESRGR